MHSDNKYLKIAGNIFLSYYIEAADLLNIKYEVVTPSLMARFQSVDKHWFIITTAVPINNVPSSTIAKRKNLSYKVLKAAGIPVAEQLELKSEEDALTFYKSHANIVIKPIRNLGGIGVTVLPNSEVEVVKAYNLAYEKCMLKTPTRVLGEQFATGTNYRFLVLDNKVLGVVRRLPAMVTGDGVTTLQELIARKNSERKLRVLKPIPIDEELFTRITAQNLTLESVPKLNEEVKLRFNSNLSTGGTTVECHNEVAPYYEQIAIDAVKALGLKLGGVDIIAEDINNPSAPAVINEVNWNPGLRLHYMVDEGEQVKVALPIMEYIRENS